VQIKKPSFTICDVDDVTFGSSAVFQNRNIIGNAGNIKKLGQQQLQTRPVAFRPHLSMGLALPDSNLVLPMGYGSSHQEMGGHIFILFSMGTSVLEVSG
jgi:hypothetical protein